MQSDIMQQMSADQHTVLHLQPECDAMNKEVKWLSPSNAISQMCQQSKRNAIN